MRKRIGRLIGRGEFPDPGTFRYIQSHFLEEPSRSRFAEFWSTAEAIAALPNRNLVGALPQAYAHCLRCAMDEIASAGRESGSSWSKVSRSVVKAKRRYESVHEPLLGGKNEGAALAELFEAIEEMAVFHDTEVPQDVRNLTNLVYVKTGARLIGMNPHPAEEFRLIKRDLAQMAHSSCTWEELADLRTRAIEVLTRLFRPPDEQMETIRLLAARAPTPEDAEALQQLITNEHQLRFFLSEIADPSWLTALADSDILAPSPHARAWPGLLAVERFREDHPDAIGDWLVLCYGSWKGRPLVSAAFAAAARLSGPPGNDLLLRILKDSPEDTNVRRQALAALDHTDPADEFTSEVGEILLTHEARR